MLSEDEREGDIQAAKAYRELAEDPIAENMPGRKEWYLEQADRLERT
jgi:hypothetical protein